MTSSTPGSAAPSPRRDIRTRWPVAPAALVQAVLAIFVLVTPASAASVDVESLGTFSRSFSPPVTLTPQTVTVASTFDYATCPVGSPSTGTGSLSLGCVPVTVGPAAAETITWQDTTGGTSTIDWASPVITGQTVVYTGTVSAGRHAGDTATKVTSGTSYLGSVIGCSFGTPISSTTGLVDSFLLTH
ncbi:hypothetical protein [Actinokineospora globicatena]|uniref:hypothetical protein n=1 Tax=Actinokineospora globicatena TaxID=103729 RepID=UPI0020A51FD3|nr:hypothetical protein [Actinokineospora globicatena]MCP2303317.1 hypothetical protein [Actinokineospora globicatena]GLW79551.1 hypothetical protein Aglo01_40330 [Actinokineospora globicatena]GLW86039.1 hypothetical protein Aglo02_36780 [Actinokineospora globicatena]